MQVHNKIGNMTTFVVLGYENSYYSNISDFEYEPEYDLFVSPFRLVLHDSEVKLKESINEIYFYSD